MALFTEASAKKVEALARKPGVHHIEAGLYLRIAKPPSRAASWCFRYTLQGRAHEAGLGPYPAIGLGRARELAGDLRSLKAERVDPVAHRRKKRMADEARAKTFSTCAAEYIAGRRAGWRNSKHAKQWGATLKAYAEPIIGNMAAADIGIGDVKRVLVPIWTEKAETASRVRQRIEAVLDYAAAHGYRSGDNPAKLSVIEKVLPDRGNKSDLVEHHAALAHKDVPAFVTALRAQEGTAARALEFLILTAARTGEVIGATWDEIDLAAKTWTIPKARMKAAREHRVPLSSRAIAILEAMKGQGNDYVFPGLRKGKPLSNMAMLKLLERMKRDEFTPHGFRSSFKDWATEKTKFKREVVEMALAHAIENKVEAAYMRTDMFEQRAKLMAAWAKWCG